MRTVPAGVAVLSSSSGVQLITEQAVSVPPATFPLTGQARVQAHALTAGPGGNLAPFAVNGPYSAALYVRNLAAFTGGQDARTYQAVTRDDLAEARATLHTALMRGMQATLQQQLHVGEALVLDTCPEESTSSAQVGEEATRVQVTLTLTCPAARAYLQQDLETAVQGLLSAQVMHHFGSAYVLMVGSVSPGTPQHVLRIGSDRLSLTLTASGTAVFQVRQADLDRYARLAKTLL